MTTTHKDPRAVIEQLVGALEAGPSTLHTYPGAEDCLCSQCEFVRLRGAALTAGSEALKLRTCTWTQHDDVHMPDTYETECGELWSFVEGGPSENKTKFCHGCGGLVCAPVGINGLTEAETSASMSVLGLSKPTEPAPSTAGERAEYLTLSAIRAIAVEAIRAVTGCPDIKGNGKYLVDEIDDVAKHAALLQYTPDTRPVGELTDEQIRSIAESVGEEMWPDNGDVGWTDEDAKFHRMFFVRALAAARSQSVTDND